MAKKNIEGLNLVNIERDDDKISLVVKDADDNEQSISLPFVSKSACEFCFKVLSWSLKDNVLESGKIAKIRLDGIEVSEGSSSKRPYQHCQQFLQLLAESVDKEHDVQYFAKKLGVTPSYLFVVVRDYTGKSPSDIIASYIISNAKNLLDSTNLTCKQISKEMNFPNQSFFGKFFKRYTGMAPLEYRRQRRLVLFGNDE